MHGCRQAPGGIKLIVEHVSGEKAALGAPLVSLRKERGATAVDVAT